jgi:hypothetical protein
LSAPISNERTVPDQVLADIADYALSCTIQIVFSEFVTPEG